MNYVLLGTIFFNMTAMGKCKFNDKPSHLTFQLGLAMSLVHSNGFRQRKWHCEFNTDML